MNKNKLVVAYSFEEACSKENDMVSVNWTNRFFQIIMIVCIAVFRLLHVIWQRVFLNLLPPETNLQPDNIVIYLQGMLGDVSVHLPAIKAIRKHYPAAKINCVCYSEGFPIHGLLGGLPYFDNLIVLTNHPVVRKGFKIVFSDSRLEKINADLFINFSPFANRGVPGFVAREMAFASKIGSKFYAGDSLSLYGVSKWSSSVKRLFVRNEPRRGWRVVKALGIKPVGTDEELFPKVDDIYKSLLHKIEEPFANYAVIHPGAKFAVKCWPSSFYGELAAYLQQHYGFSVFVTGSASESDIVNKVVAASHKSAISLCGKTTIPEMIELLRGAAIVVTNDTGPMHLSSLLDRPTVAIFGTRMTIGHWYPVGSKTTALMHYHENSFSYDDKGDVPHLMDHISVETVITEVDKLLCAS